MSKADIVILNPYIEELKENSDSVRIQRMTLEEVVEKYEHVMTEAQKNTLKNFKLNKDNEK